MYALMNFVDGRDPGVGTLNWGSVWPTCCDETPTAKHKGGESSHDFRRGTGRGTAAYQVDARDRSHHSGVPYHPTNVASTARRRPGANDQEVCLQWLVLEHGSLE